MPAPATTEKPAKPRRRLAATARVGLLILALAVSFWAFRFWRAWQVHELLAAADQPPARLSFGPAWMRTTLGDRVYSWFNAEPASLNFFRSSHDEAWFHRLSAVPDLRELGFEKTSFGDAGLKYIEPLTKLKTLDFIDCPRITDASLPRISGFANLEGLFLYGTGVTDAGMPALAKLRNLEFLSLQRTAIGDAGLAYVADLPNLQKLLLGTDRIVDGSPPITERGLAELVRLPKLKLLALWNVELTEGAVEALRSLKPLSRLLLTCRHATIAEVRRLHELPNLIRLDLADAALGDEMVDALLEIPSLRQLELDRTRITDAGLSRLAASPGLDDLTLAGTEISAAGLAAFAGHQRLYQLGLDDTKVGDEVIDLLLAMPFLTHVNLSGTAVTDAGVMRLASHRGLKWLGLSRTAVTAVPVNALLRRLPIIYGLLLDELPLVDDDLDAFIASRAPRAFPLSICLKRTGITQAGIARFREKVGGKTLIDWEPKP